MKVFSSVKYLPAMILGIAALGMSGIASAIPCGNGFVNGGGASYTCQDGPFDDSNDSAADLNTLPGFFNITGWSEIAKEEGDNSSGNIGLVVTPLPSDTAFSGTWSFNDIWSLYDNIIIVLKDGSVTTPGGNVFWSAYLVDFDDTSGNWDVGSISGSLSHLTVYGTRVPAPVTLGLVGIGLVGIGFARRLRKNV